MCFLYILPWLHENAFKLALQCSIRIDFDSGCVWNWLCAFAAVPGPLPGYSQRAVLFDSGFIRSCRAVWFSWAPCSGLFLIGWRFPGGTKAPRKCTTSQKQHQNQVGLNWKNLKKIEEI